MISISCFHEPSTRLEKLVSIVPNALPGLGMHLQNTSERGLIMLHGGHICRSAVLLGELWTVHVNRKTKSQHVLRQKLHNP